MMSKRAVLYKEIAFILKFKKKENMKISDI